MNIKVPFGNSRTTSPNVTALNCLSEQTRLAYVLIFTIFDCVKFLVFQITFQKCYLWKQTCSSVES